MKFTFALLALPLASGFAPSTFGVQRQTAIFSAPVDTSSAVQAALQASKQYGATSPEARVAWDAVEEMRANDDSPATQGSLADECDIDEDKVSAACLEYGSKIEELNKLLADQVPHLNNVKTLADDLQKIKLIVTKNQPAPDSPQVRAALEHAKAMSAEHGTTSPEAKVAWDSLEEIASSGLSNAMGAGLDQECLVESAMEACLALEELNRVLNLEKSKNEGANS